MIANNVSGRVREEAMTSHYLAARVIRDAAWDLGADVTIVVDHDRCREVVARLDFVFAEVKPTRDDILAASPGVIDRSGRKRTIVEMLENEPPDGESRLRLAKLLLRVLNWY